MDDDMRDTERRVASDAESMMFKINVFSRVVLNQNNADSPSQSL